MVRYFGIRHFSPFCGHYVREFLDRADPSAVVIEAPKDHEVQLVSLNGAGLRLPVSLLAYTESLPMRTLTFPLTVFSPEWNALEWARERGVPAVFCDIPCGAAMYHALNDKPQRSDLYDDDSDPSDEMSVQSLEEQEALMREKGSALRGRLADDYTLLREAFMRRHISEAEERYGSCAVIVGALHLAGIEGVPFSERDRRLTGNAPTISVKLTLMPDSCGRISGLRGYGRRARDPAGSELMFRDLRGGRHPKPDYSAAERAALGDVCGRLPDGVYCSSLADDLRLHLEALRLGELIKRGSAELTLDVDEYNIMDSKRSELLHALLSLGVDIGSFTSERRGDVTRERWDLRMPSEAELSALAVCGCTIGRALVSGKTVGNRNR